MASSVSTVFSDQFVIERGKKMMRVCNELRYRLMSHRSGRILLLLVANIILSLLVGYYGSFLAHTEKPVAASVSNVNTGVNEYSNPASASSGTTSTTAEGEAGTETKTAEAEGGAEAGTETVEAEGGGDSSFASIQENGSDNNEAPSSSTSSEAEASPSAAMQEQDEEVAVDPPEPPPPPPQAPKTLSPAELETPDTKPPFSIPSMYKTGGVIFFYHLAGTGGRQIRSGFGDYPDKSKLWYERLRSKKEEFYRISDEHVLAYIHDEKLNQPGGKHQGVLMIEHHGELSMLDMERHFQRWRDASIARNVPVFIFTILREPVSYAVEHFNTFHAPPGCYPYIHELYDPTEDNLKVATLPEYQLRMLGYGGVGKKELGPEVDDVLNKNIRDYLDNYFDWVGTTEDLHERTWPLLNWLVFGDLDVSRVEVTVPEHYPNQDKENILDKEDLSREALAYLQTINRHSLELWQDAKDKQSKYDNV